jgi:oligogalacturonide lyase
MLGAGTMDDGPPVAGEYSQGPRRERPAGITQSEAKGEMMERRLASRQPLMLYTVAISPGPDNGKMKILLHSTDWINHLLFSPSDPELLMYCHEGPWQKVDRVWMIHTDGTHNTLIHKRTMAMEIAGHEFWGLDGKTIWYDWQYPKGQVFFLAGYNLQTGKRIAYHMERNEWSIHFNVTRDADLFTGDGGDPGQVAKAPDGEWIELFHPEMIPLNGALNAPDFWQPGIFRSEHLVNMAHHNYRLEPNVRFSPDNKIVIFRSNMFGPTYVFGVEVAKATDVTPSEVRSTPELAAKFNPVKSTPTNVYQPSNPPAH